VIVEAPVPLEETWPAFKEADESRDLDDVKEALGALCTSFRGSSWQDMEKKLREEKCNTYLAALVCLEKSCTLPSVITRLLFYQTSSDNAILIRHSCIDFHRITPCYLDTPS